MKTLIKAIEFIQHETLVPVTICGVEDDAPFAMWRGISVIEGHVYVDLEKAHVGDLLHEVGHIVTVPHRLRRLMTGNFESEEFLHSLADTREENEEQAPLFYSDDDAATFWAFSVCRHLGLDDTLPFHKGYDSPDTPWQDYHLSCQLGVGSKMGSRFSVNLYYVGMLAKKSDEFPIVWDIEYLKGR